MIKKATTVHFGSDCSSVRNSGFVDPTSVNNSFDLVCVSLENDVDQKNQIQFEALIAREDQDGSPCKSLMWEISSVEDVVLEHEEDVKEDGEEAETKFGRVAKDARPVIVVVSDQDHLQEGGIEVFKHQHHDHDLNDGETSASEV